MDSELNDKLASLAAATRDVQLPETSGDSFTDAVMQKILAASATPSVVVEDEEEALDRISITTASIEPEVRLSDAVMVHVAAGDFSDLDRLAVATASLDVGGDFTDAIMRAVLVESAAAEPSQQDVTAHASSEQAVAIVDLRPSLSSAGAGRESRLSSTGRSSRTSRRSKPPVSTLVPKRNTARATFLFAAFAAAASVMFTWYTQRTIDTDTIVALESGDGEG